MASAAEALGMTLPGSSSYPAEYKEKLEECASVGSAMRNLLEQNILPRDIMTRSAFENAMVTLTASVSQPLSRLKLPFRSGPHNDSGWLD